MAHSKLKRINTKLSQGRVLSPSPTLFNIYISDIQLPPNDIQITTYVNNIIITTSHTKHRKAQQLIQPYLQEIYEWATANNVHINTDKITTTLFTPDPAECGTTLSLKLNNQTLTTAKYPKILGITLDPKLTFSQHSESMHWSKQEINCLHIQSHHLLHFGICKHHMESYRIKYQHQEHSFVNCY